MQFLCFFLTTPSLAEMHCVLIRDRPVVDYQERFGECAIAESTKGTVQTLRLTFAGHQEVKQFARR
ncbi:MAG: hypothetical protein PUQ00_26525 [Nostoc sp. S13]|nr:hypothetical protein [Nostoc sp. S13]